MKEKQYENEISLAKFLTRYVYVTGKDLTKLTHDDIKELFPYLKRTSFEYIDLHPGCVECGEVALVNDGKKIIPYYIPKIVDYDRPTEIHIKKPKKYKEGYHDYLSMSNYELKCLLENKLNKYKNRIKAREELMERGVLVRKKYKRDNNIKFEED